jgi:hypothetical protein
LESSLSIVKYKVAAYTVTLFKPLGKYMSIQYHGTNELTHEFSASATALTPQLTTILPHEPTVADYDITSLTATTPYGFASQDEGLTVLTVVANLQVRLAEIETRLKNLGILI